VKVSTIYVGANDGMLHAFDTQGILQPIFNTHFLNVTEWTIVVGLALIPAAAEEVTKFFLRRK